MEIKYIENPDNLECCMEHQELLDLLYELLQELNHIAGKHFFESGTQNKKQVENMWLHNLLTYAAECYNSAAAGNFFSLAIVLRTMVENYIYAYYIKRDKKNLLWKRWLLQSHIQALHSLNSDNTQQAEHELAAICQAFGFPYDKAMCDSFIRHDKEWLRPAAGDNSRLTMAELSGPIDSKISKDYRKLCGYSHGGRLYKKSMPFAFYDSFLFLLCVLLDYTADTADLFIPRNYCTNRYRMLLFSAYQRLEGYIHERETYIGEFTDIAEEKPIL